MLPVIKLGGEDVTRLIVGGNPFSGNSHVSRALDAQMEDFFTTEKVKETLFRCEQFGINTMQLRGDKHIMRIIREYRLDGGKMHWIAQTASEIGSFEGNIRTIMAYKPLAIYHHGTLTDSLYKEGKIDELRKRLEIIRAAGVPVGLATHMPHVMEQAEDENWGVDFYMACVYNISRQNRVSSAITGVSNEDERFVDEDIPVMYDMIKKVSKPCLAFKILGATRRCQSQETVRSAFDEAYASIKSTDAVIVGVYPKNEDQVKLNCGYAADAMRKL